ncbi:MAG TPA: hypothetical protein VMZ25_08275, partial [Terriglobales bacterium]|nr:hypothetical protein [Terriglobales bacterium]
AKANAGPREQVTPEEAAQRREREVLLLSRKQVAAQLESASAARHRQMLERALCDIDSKLAQAK